MFLCLSAPSTEQATTDAAGQAKICFLPAALNKVQAEWGFSGLRRVILVVYSDSTMLRFVKASAPEVESLLAWEFRIWGDWLHAVLGARVQGLGLRSGALRAL